jgi:hypothetical protein
MPWAFRASRDGQSQVVVCDAGSDLVFAPEASNPRGDGSPIGTDDLAAAMREDCPGDAFQLAPLELRADRGVAYDVFPAPSLQWPSDACPVAYVERHAAQPSSDPGLPPRQGRKRAPSFLPRGDGPPRAHGWNAPAQMPAK